MSGVRNSVFLVLQLNLMLFKLNLTSHFGVRHSLLERDERLKFLLIKTYDEVAPRSP